MPVIIWLCDRAVRFQSKPTFHPCSPQSPSSSVVRASVLEHGGPWVQIPSGTRIFSEFDAICILFNIFVTHFGGWATLVLNLPFREFIRSYLNYLGARCYSLEVPKIAIHSSFLGKPTTSA